MSADQPQRRRDDADYDAEASFIKKAIDNPIVTRGIHMLVAAALGAAAGSGSHQVADATEVKVIQDNRAAIEGLKQEIRELREGFTQRVKVEEVERENAMMGLWERLIYLEAQRDAPSRRRRAPETAERPRP